jgi:hypothetical protein
MLDREFREKIQIARREFGKCAHGFGGPFYFEKGQELRGEHLREHDEITLVVRGNIDKIRTVLGEVVEIFDHTHHVLYCTHPYV